jgi:PAS domain-containing protein
MWTFDAESGAITAANGAACLAYGYPEDGLLACHERDLCPGLTGEEGRALLLAAQAEAAPVMGVFRQHRLDGSTFEAHLAVIHIGGPARIEMMVLVQPSGPDRHARSSTSPHREVA